MPCFSKQSNRKLKIGREVTDICWLVIFIFFCFGMIIIASFALVYGNPLRLVYGYDSFGNVCGVNNEPMGKLTNSGLDLTDKKFLFFFNLYNVRDSLRICVRQCPTVRLNDSDDLKQFAVETDSRLCRYDIPVERYTDSDPLTGNGEVFSKSDVNYGPCPSTPVYATFPLLNRCIPKRAKELTSDVIYNIHGYLNNFDLFQQMLSDLYVAWKEMILLALIACTLSVMMVFCIHCLVKAVYWIVFIGVGFGTVGGTCFLWWTYFEIKDALDSTPSDELLEEMVHNERAFFIYSVVASVVTQHKYEIESVLETRKVILLIVLLFLRKEVPKVEKLFEEAGNCLWELPCLFLQPFWTVVVLIIFFLFWIFVMLALGTADLPNSNEISGPLNSNSSKGSSTNSTNATSDWTSLFAVNIEAVKGITVIDYIDPSWVKYMWWYYFIALIWISEFILACQQMILAGTVAKWYFAEDRDEMRCTIPKAFFNLVLFHLGSVAKGSFLITVFKVPRLILTYLQEQLNGSPDGSCKRCCSKGCICCLWCFEKFIKYINHNAYTVIAIDGCNFCPAAQEAFACLVKNTATIAALNSIGDFVLFLAKCLVTSITAIIGLLVMKLNPNLHFYAFPILIVCIFAFFISHCILSLFEIVLDTLTLCYCESAEHADESLRACFKKTNDAAGESNDGIELETLRATN